jgi:hypothetical protein
VKHLFKYINCLFKEPKTLEIKKENDKERRKELYKELNKEIRDLKSDLINNKIEDSKEEYHNWIKENKCFLFPNKVNKSVAYDVKCNPEKYIKYSFYINQKIEELGKRPYQTIPQRNNIVPKHIVLNTPAIVDLINDKEMSIFSYNKSELVLHAKKHQKHIWSKLLKLEKNDIFKQKEYVFYNQIITDGFSCSLLFILKKYKDKVFGDKLPEVNNDFEFSMRLLSSGKEVKFCDKAQIFYRSGISSLSNMTNNVCRSKARPFGFYFANIVADNGTLYCFYRASRSAPRRRKVLNNI